MIDDQHRELEIWANSELHSVDQRTDPSNNREHDVSQYDIAENIIDDQREGTKLDLELDMSSDDNSVELDSTRPCNEKHEISRYETTGHIVGDQEKMNKNYNKKRMGR